MRGNWLVIPRDLHLGVLSADDNWVVMVWLNHSPVKFQIDTGAEVTVIPAGVFEKLSGAKLQPSQRTLRGASQRILPLIVQFTGKLALEDWKTARPFESPASDWTVHRKTCTGRPQDPLRVLPLIGQFTGKLALEDRKTLQEVYVVDKLHKPLLGRPAIEAMGLLGVRSVNQEKPIEHFPQLFQGLGRMQGEYSIQLKEGAVPFALTAPGRVAIPLMESVKAEFQRMEKLGLISQIESPTDWCAGMVVVPKPNKRVRICVDLTKLNENVLRERHPLPAVEQTMAQIARAKVSLSWTQTQGYGRSRYLQSLHDSQRSSLPSGGTVLTASHSASCQLLNISRGEWHSSGPGRCRMPYGCRVGPRQDTTRARRALTCSMLRNLSRQHQDV